MPRFRFGRNWAKYVQRVEAEHVQEAERSLLGPLGGESLTGMTFLDVGCGSGLFSLAAARLGASVTSFDYDRESVASAKALKARFGPELDWDILEGSVLDSAFLSSLGKHDLVYSWGVLHHTGRMWDAIEKVTGSVARPGRLWIAIYNDQGRASRRWRAVKRLYNVLPGPLRPALVAVSMVRLWGPTFVRELVAGTPLRSWREYRCNRGMSPWHDAVDWVGGYPFEVATPAQVEAFLDARHFDLEWERTVDGGLGCNEFIFRKR